MFYTTDLLALLGVRYILIAIQVVAYSTNMGKNLLVNIHLLLHDILNCS